MNVWQKIRNKLFGTHYILYAYKHDRLEVRRVHNTGGALWCYHDGMSGDQFYLTKDKLASSPAHLATWLATYSMAAQNMATSVSWKWAALTEGLEGLILMYPSEDDFLPRIEVDGVQSSPFIMGHSHNPRPITATEIRMGALAPGQVHYANPSNPMSFAPGDGVLD